MIFLRYVVTLCLKFGCKQLVLQPYGKTCFCRWLPSLTIKWLLENTFGFEISEIRGNSLILIPTSQRYVKCFNKTHIVVLFRSYIYISEIVDQACINLYNLNTSRSGKRKGS